MFYKKCRRKMSIQKEISYKDIDFMVKNYNMVIVDVRARAEFIEEHIEGAINIPLEELSRKIEKLGWSLNKYILVYCSYGYRSKKAQNILGNMGFINVYNLRGGF